ncbi:uncharacterized protein C7orf57 homolog [Diadema antillarum]|uniref:uncharacterized protein C7orf57 homolog n=1 Tax=Diadema antillarum TaxID=105358 RepID=UPI003A88338A
MAGGTQDWFYHAPSKKDSGGQVEYPAASQIPSLGGGIPYDEWEKDERDATGMKRGWIRDTDSKYIQLCKRGGRKDLLRQRDPPKKASEPKDYPRADWFYYDTHEASQSNQYRSHLPDYMVYEEYRPEDHGDEVKGYYQRPPFSLDDKMTAFERHGDTVTDKLSMKFPNDESKLRKPPKDKTEGKDFRRKKQVDRNANTPNRQKYKQMSVPESYRSPAQIGSLLANTYQSDWYKHRDEEFGKQKPSSAEVQFQAATRADRQSTEYRDAISKGGKQNKGAGAYSRNALEVRGTKKTEQVKAMRTEQEGDKELFKLSKFDKVGSKVNSRWSSSSPINHAADQEVAVAPVVAN